VACGSTHDMQAIRGQGDSHGCAMVTIKLCTFFTHRNGPVGTHRQPCIFSLNITHL